MNETNRCGCNRYVSERYNERRCNNERFGECREKTCGCHHHGMNGQCCGWRPAPVRPCRPMNCGCDDMMNHCGCRPNPCHPRPCPPRPRPCPPRPCHPCRPCWGPMPYGRMNEFDDYDNYSDMDYMGDEYWDDYGNEMKKEVEASEKGKEEKE